MYTRSRILLTTLMAVAALSLSTGAAARDRDGWRDRGQHYGQWDQRYHPRHTHRDRVIIREGPVFYPRYYDSWRYYETRPYYVPAYAPPYYAPPYYRVPGGASVVIDFNLPPIVIR